MILLGSEDASLPEDNATANSQAEKKAIGSSALLSDISNHATLQGRFQKILSIQEDAVNLADCWKRTTPLFYACGKGHEAIVQAIVASRHATVDITDDRAGEAVTNCRSSRQSFICVLNRQPSRNLSRTLPMI